MPGLYRADTSLTKYQSMNTFLFAFTFQCLKLDTGNIDNLRIKLRLWNLGFDCSPICKLWLLQDACFVIFFNQSLSYRTENIFWDFKKHGEELQLYRSKMGNPRLFILMCFSATLLTISCFDNGKYYYYLNTHSEIHSFWSDIWDHFILEVNQNQNI